MQPSATRCAVRARAAVRTTVAGLPALRQEAQSALQLPANFLKYADEQTVVGLTAVVRASVAHGLPLDGFDSWGVLAAPRFLGRAALPPMIKRFQDEGAWGVTPHFIPHHSLHSVSGQIGLALNVHGPNYGVGGGPHALAEALLTAAALLAEDDLPGVWVVATGWLPDRVGSGRATGDEVCTGVALALTAVPDGWTGPTLDAHTPVELEALAAVVEAESLSPGERS